MTTIDKEIRFTQRLAKFLASLTVAEVKALADGRAELTVVTKGERTRKRPSKASKPDLATLHSVLQYLHGARDREVGLAKLEREVSTKTALESLARLADLPVQRNDTIEDLRQRIIEATIGYRLRSQAVKGNNAV